MTESSYTTEQEAFWAGQFGTEYSARNVGAAVVASNTRLFSHALRSCGPLRSALEFGANIGLNLRALAHLYPGIDLEAIEINATAAAELAAWLGAERVAQKSLYDWQPSRTFDLVLIKGVLIHLHPDRLPHTYDLLHAATGRFLLVAEYYNPTPVSVSYRGNADRLYKRDFAGELLDRFPDLELADYGFVYRRDPAFPQDDLTWFLLRKR